MWVFDLNSCQAGVVMSRCAFQTRSVIFDSECDELFDNKPFSVIKLHGLCLVTLVPLLHARTLCAATV